MSRVKRVVFNGDCNKTYAGLIYFSPLNTNNYVIFNHCFDAVQHEDVIMLIIDSLTMSGINVFQFEQMNTEKKSSSYLTEIPALISANKFLSEYYAPPSFIIGHGFNAVCAFLISTLLDNIKGVVAFFACTPTFIKRQKNVTREFLDSIEYFNFNEILNTFSKPLLMFYSLSDNLIPISESSSFYNISKAEKNFVTLKKSDHFLNDKSEIDYILRTIEIWVKQYVGLGQKDCLTEPNQVVVYLHKNLEQKICNHFHQWVADEPVSNGGNGLGPDPYELLLSALGACTNMTLKIYANYKKIDLGEIKTTLRYEKKRLFPESDNVSLVIFRDIIFKNQMLDWEMVAKFKKIANKCPIHKTLIGDIVIETQTYQGTEK